jgi:hypothetical protein
MGLRMFVRFSHTKSRFLKNNPAPVPDFANNVLRGRPRVYNGGGSSRVVLLQIETVLPLAVRKDHLVPPGGLDSGLTSRGGSISPRGPAVAPPPSPASGCLETLAGWAQAQKARRPIQARSSPGWRPAMSTLVSSSTAGILQLPPGNRSPASPALAGTFLGSVDGWLLATVLLGHRGECLRRYPPPGADWRLQPSFLGAYAA